MRLPIGMMISVFLSLGFHSSRAGAVMRWPVPSGWCWAAASLSRPPGSATTGVSDRRAMQSRPLKKKVFHRRQPITFFFSCLHTGVSLGRVVTGDPLAGLLQESRAFCRCQSALSSLADHSACTESAAPTILNVLPSPCPPSSVSVDVFAARCFKRNRSIQRASGSAITSLSSALVAPSSCVEGDQHALYCVEV